MNYAQMRPFDIANGPGVRATLFVTGCTHHCPACFNGEYQDFNYGFPWTPESEDDFLNLVKDANVHGVSLLGGEPLQQDDAMCHLVKRIKTETEKTLWVYTGYTYEFLIGLDESAGQLYRTVQAVLQYADVLVDGPFIESLKDLKLKFRGSSNQRLIDVQASRKKGEVVSHVL